MKKVHDILIFWNKVLDKLSENTQTIVLTILSILLVLIVLVLNYFLAIGIDMSLWDYTYIETAIFLLVIEIVGLVMMCVVINIILGIVLVIKNTIEDIVKAIHEVKEESKSFTNFCK